ncbi:MAG: glycoside hydrolase family 9 protein [Kiritimatiellae bacterium]|nr:glycoside hydrolase family 9 protein [Kiritimatiellia bacterium]
MHSLAIVLAASMTRFLDPYTSLYQTDDAREGRALASEPGFWPSANGQADPLAAKPRARVLYSVFRTGDRPLPGYDPERPSPLFKVNQVGYAPDQPKFAYLGAWLGPKLGAWKPRWGEEGRGMREEGGWSLVDAKTGRVAFVSPVPPVLRVRDAATKEGTPFTGEETYEMDFSSVTGEGTYFVHVAGVGRSADFRIWRGAAEDAFRVHMGGLYQKRCGIAKTEPFTHWTAGACHTNAVRGTFAPEEGRLPKDIRWFDVIRQNTDWENGERVSVSGGWHDAADYDRRPAHLRVVNDLCAVYLMKPSNFRDGQLAVPENANGIPDVLDEAEWGLRHLLQVQQPDGGVGTWIETTGHPVPGNVAERDAMRYAVSRATRASSLEYAAHAALLARCNVAFRAKYLDSAKRAWNFAVTSAPARETFFVSRKKGFFSREERAVEWEEPKSLPALALAKAAVNLAALTGDRSYLDEVSRRRKEAQDDFRKNEWRWGALSLAGERALGLPPEVSWLAAEWERKLVNRANEMVRQAGEAYAYRCPWYFPGKGWCNAMSWGQCHPLRRAQTLVAAHAATGDGKYLAAAYAALDFHNGCNPQGTTLTSGLGHVYPIAFLDLPSYVDGIAEYVPGITPYRWNYGMPAKAVELVYGGDKTLAVKCPIWRRWGNVENLTVAASEYTVWETIAPAASVCGYLLSPTGTPPPVRPAPADDVRKLLGYWTMP